MPRDVASKLLRTGFGELDADHVQNTNPERGGEAVSRSFLMALDAGGGGGHCLLVETESGTFTRAFRSWAHPA